MKEIQNRCSICIDEECKKNGGSPGSCKCSECKKIAPCPKILGATIRITNRCTQKCRHCCFASSPESDIMMSVKKAEEIAKFIDVNGVERLNLMGGEFFCNPEWFRILDLFLGTSAWSVRLVSNGDWHGRSDVKEGIEMLVGKYHDKFSIAISDDQWHTNSWKDTDLESFLEKIDVIRSSKGIKLGSDGIVPIGRSFLEYSYYSSWGAYCHHPFNKYGFLIDEDGDCYRCSFGVYHFANVSDYLEGGFREKWKDTAMWFNSLPIMNCKMCIGTLESPSFTKTAKKLKRE